jgi:hypothetical protein
MFTGTSRSEEGNNGAKLCRIVAWVLRAEVIVTRVPELRLKRFLGRAEGDMPVAPERVEARGASGGSVRSCPHDRKNSCIAKQIESG